ncbi:MAG: STAS/SEC14 domain-containing protein [Pseudomonadota bacterium]|nr:STAS/SEC14 domain-containing protein [Pseudomonadota bacterium]
MIEILPDSEGDLLAVKATGKLTAEDYDQVFVPQVESRIQSYGKARLLLHLDERFSGWEVGAMWEDAKFGIRHRHDFSKIAVVGGAAWIDWSAKMAAHFMDGQLKTFAGPELQSAWAWVKADSPAG